ncbi:uncharacterized protein LOC122510539 [Leptopilina heterotoma]|uniref:uncharacterized protein LOC122510539 n=1 Tax=Leptopilina heterotoma TaxID=63436 RepID=UPI001CA9AA17|nr:uncharacterized protein LOC122510539 [Leptopilina heterotoma]XP_043481215.1 uncharacterized protein LOC122510539 [Leptopilina heterotoma]XP_043481216.1 uncharacterized protein LOC122510539 [Leptopilina heterotoma]XP_043481217.1 uncharacterized protein LOC122510539 [Leptopilina heterotoma]XP_043481218.1 uncharacterized protein LOC122510539 [Leptopilina heterotoma]XP_043481219.1 uncharacterized protein LOC122510539 [Leptopilina heterotoma]XP_043481220.1 uncharacterized protein LOC122510539 [
MKGFLAIFLLIAVTLAVTNAYRSPVHKPKPKQPAFPTFPGQGPWNPKIKPYPVRVARSSEKKGHVKVEAQKDGKKSSYNVDVGHKIYKNKHGSISISGGVRKDPYSKPQQTIGIQGSFSF